jgi:hypothetical protein
VLTIVLYIDINVNIMIMKMLGSLKLFSKYPTDGSIRSAGKFRKCDCLPSRKAETGEPLIEMPLHKNAGAKTARWI